MTKSVTLTRGRLLLRVLVGTLSALGASPAVARASPLTGTQVRDIVREDRRAVRRLQEAATRYLRGARLRTYVATIDGDNVSLARREPWGPGTGKATALVRDGKVEKVTVWRRRLEKNGTTLMRFDYEPTRHSDEARLGARWLHEVGRRRDGRSGERRTMRRTYFLDARAVAARHTEVIEDNGYRSYFWATFPER
ncbi:MAG: hypothetical protein IT371_31870 [Deltaproteobacteria bacterium]|nr:hypothetical protein [Deltaproteobacteria bacterium]